MPAPGRTWAQTPALHQAIFERFQHDPWDDVAERLHRSFDRVRDVIETYSDVDLFAKKQFPWTGSTSVGSYFVSASSSHYAWASKLIRKWAKTLAPPQQPPQP
jgi:hypothetical protein